MHPAARPSTHARADASTSERTTLASRLHDRTATVGIIGLGFAGLPLGVALAGAGFRVIGVDLDASKVDAKFSDGILNVHVAKSAAAQPKQIEIKGA